MALSVTERERMAEQACAAAVSESKTLKRQKHQLVAALRVALRAPGIWDTDQQTGQPFGDTIKAALAAAGVQS